MDTPPEFDRTKVEAGIKPTGTVYLVGAGPGAPDLLTLRAARIIGDADIVFHDALIHPDVVAMARKAIIVSVGKRCGTHSTAQRFINKRVVDAAREHAVVVRLKGGDPMLFGRAQEEITALETAGIPFEVIPGITAALAASAETATSLTQRGAARSVTFVTPRVGAGQEASCWAAPLRAADAAAIYMGLREASAITANLLATGMPEATPLVVVENASLPNARRFYGTLGSLQAIAELDLTGPAVILIGAQFVERNSMRSLELDVGALAA
ncbi:MAG: uroporphyrinogen-III C-methyltransferase [Pseudomonadota bacterium]|nr:uroporphyrinogen-III C-methyltransferase [Pseudomonadota bacterium]